MNPSDSFTIAFVFLAASLYAACFVWFKRHEFKDRICDDCGQRRQPGERPHEITGCPEQSWAVGRALVRPLRPLDKRQSTSRIRRVIEKGPKRDCQVIDFVDFSPKPDDTSSRFIEEIKRMLLDGYGTRDEIEHKTIGSDEPDSCPGPCPRVKNPYDHEQTLGSYRLRPGSDPEMD